VRFRAPTPIIVEFGSWKGRSTIWLASGVKDRGEGRVYAVDTWEGSPGEEAHRDLLKGFGPDQLYEEFLQHL
jgi:predicted O-methyltransferase YrrM